MIKRIAGAVPTRSRAVVHGGIVYTVAVSADKFVPLYEQTRAALARLDQNLADAGSNKSLILSATVYITDMSNKDEMNRAWDEWVDRTSPPQRACIGATLEGRDLIEIVVTAAVRAS
jgi:enamine deaminase RidA (YjgF/YER057c/UK114 family)